MKNFVEANASPMNSLIFFIAGHGVYLKAEIDPDSKRTIESDPYFLTFDSNPQDPNTTGYPMDEFRRMVAEQAQRYARVLVYADVCHAGNIAGVGGNGGLQDAVKKVSKAGPAISMSCSPATPTNMRLSPLHLAAAMEPSAISSSPDSTAPPLPAKTPCNGTISPTLSATRSTGSPTANRVPAMSPRVMTLW